MSSDALNTAVELGKIKNQLDYVASGLESRIEHYQGLDWTEIEGLQLSLRDISGKMKALGDELDP